MLTNSARHAGLPIDLILSAELCRHYKPAPEAYRMAYELFDLESHQVMLVAAHNDDHLTAREEGLRTGFVARPGEYGPRQRTDFRAEHKFDIIVDDFHALAEQLLQGAE